MAISFVGQASAAATSVTLPAHNVGDFIIIYAYRNAVTAPSLPAGYTSIITASGNANSYRIGYKIATGSDVSGTWTNATTIQTAIYRGVASIGGSATQTGATTTTATIPALTLGDQSGHSWLIATVGSKQILSQSTPTGTTLRGTQGDGSTCLTILTDTNGGVSTWASHTSTSGLTATYTSAIIELVATNSAPATPTLITPANTGTVSTLTPQLTFSSTDGDSDVLTYNVQVDTVNTFDSQSSSPAIVQTTTGTTGATFPTTLTTTAFGSSVTTGNTIIVAASLDGLPDAHQITVTDTAGNKYIRAGTQFTSGSGQIDIWVALNVTGGATFKVTIAGYMNTTAAIIAQEWSGLPKAGTVDVSASAAGTGTAISTGATVSTTSAHEVVFVTGMASSGTAAFTLGSGFSNLTTVVSSPATLAIESMQVSATGAQTGTFTLAVSANWNALVVTFRSYSPMVNVVSGVDSGFIDITSGASNPYPSGDTIGYTTGTLTNGTMYYWRAEVRDYQVFSAFTSANSFTVNTTSPITYITYRAPFLS